MKRMDLPAEFLNRIQTLLGAEFEPFIQSFDRPEQIGLRLNPLKIEADLLKARLPWALEELPWVDGGYLIQENNLPGKPAPGKHPYHTAGVYYLQEPTAMAVAPALDSILPIQGGRRILDLCAAPGGKSTHLAGMLAGDGFLAANETHPQRVWELAENLERWGARNAIVLNETPARLGSALPGFFDAVLVDAPCSGEGMFRKSDSARRDWSPESVRACAFRQSVILDDAIRLVRPGGVLIYSTCTFNPEENEAVVAAWLKRNPDCKPASLAGISGSAPGRPEWINAPIELCSTARFWPHQGPGEGHFIAALIKDGNPRSSLKPTAGRMRSRRTDLMPYLAFVDENLAGQPPDEAGLRLQKYGARIYAVPAEAPDLAGLKVIHPGWWLGSIRTGEHGRARFVPAHALAMGLRPSQVRRVQTWAVDDPQIAAYLRGEALPGSGEPGWTLVCVDEFPLGWGKQNRGILKNEYPKGLRIH